MGSEVRRPAAKRGEGWPPAALGRYRPWEDDDERKGPEEIASPLSADYRHRR